MKIDGFSMKIYRIRRLSSQVPAEGRAQGRVLRRGAQRRRPERRCELGEGRVPAPSTGPYELAPIAGQRLPPGHCISMRCASMPGLLGSFCPINVMSLRGKPVLLQGSPGAGSACSLDRRLRFRYTQSELVLHACKLACEFLRPQGTFVSKVQRKQPSTK